MPSRRSPYSTYAATMQGARPSRPARPSVVPPRVGKTAEGAVGGQGPFNPLYGRNTQQRPGASRRRRTGAGPYD